VAYPGWNRAPEDHRVIPPQDPRESHPRLPASRRQLPVAQRSGHDGTSANRQQPIPAGAAPHSSSAGYAPASRSLRWLLRITTIYEHTRDRCDQGARGAAADRKVYSVMRRGPASLRVVSIRYQVERLCLDRRLARRDPTSRFLTS
jgi:hypothetical protein